MSEINQRRIHLLTVIVICLSITGYFIGISERGSEASLDGSSVTLNNPGVSQAVKYSDMGRTLLKPNSQWTNHIENISRKKRDRPNSVDTKRDLQSSLDSRKSNRAYAGAPPTVPHPIDQNNPASCLACHASGFETSEIIAPQMSHQHLTNCTQCHVESKGSAPNSKLSLNVISSFQGLKETSRGSRQSTHSPPTIPHSTWMRQNCTSCHGDFGKPGIKTTHPWRNNCVQCHAPSAKLDQVDFKIKK